MAMRSTMKYNIYDIGQIGGQTVILDLLEVSPLRPREMKWLA